MSSKEIALYIGVYDLTLAVVVLFSSPIDFKALSVAGGLFVLLAAFMHGIDYAVDREGKR